ncbi:helix-turn-helix domain-containing protein [Streptomyces sp. SAJ15]|uniref:winged helix-turn-helix transcriptional regulator n=1 Tax=Streptomyces sp. SAJ15 TaxID=2011095 RepID=UPI00118578C4|nr:helix-turn-helix domain-containing protein [Streptomyces sp. SAJ15]TVL89454.1 transcriptional regulator [Streptomyces sp. SAJ15]
MRKRTVECPTVAAVDVISGKWKVLILWALYHHRPRFGELRRLVPGISEKVLVQQLRELEALGVVHREVFHELPLRVEYSLTPSGIALNEALEPLSAWSRRYLTGPEESVGEESAVESGPAALPEPGVARSA